VAAGDVEERSYERLTKDHLQTLVRIAQVDLEGFFERNPHRKDYGSQVRLTALCQGAALHYLDHATGVKDLDVWTFFGELPQGRVERHRRPKQEDFGLSTLGRHPHAKKGYAGRTVDLLLTTIPRRPGQRIDDAVQDYLRAGRPPRTAYYLAQKAVIGLDPPEYFGVTVWPVGGVM
jgi:hypothetical protein